MPTKNVGGFHVGWLDMSIGSLLHARVHAAFGTSFMLVTCIDSSRDVSQVAEWHGIPTRIPDCRLIGRALLVQTSLIDVLRDSFNLFNGFDEVWFFNSEPKVMFDPAASIVPPWRIDEQQVLPMQLTSWMNASGCVLGLGDGIGVNYIASTEALADRLEAFDATSHRS